jgi:hypothetical protein
MNETECAALVAGDTISDPQGILQVLFNDTTNKKVTVSLLHSKEGTMSYDSLSDASIITSEGGGGTPDLSSCVQKVGDTMTGTLTMLGPGQYVLCENPDTGEQVMNSPANIFFKRPEFNAAFFLRAGEGGNLYFQDQATGKVIQLTDLAASFSVTQATVKELVKEVLRELLA